MKDKKPPESDAENTLKVCDYLLYEFDLSKTVGAGMDITENMGNIDKNLAQELYESFNGFFSFKECARALNFSKDDIQVTN